MSKIKTFFKYLRDNPRGLWTAFGVNGFLDWMPDRQYLRLLYKAETGHELNLENPQTFNEKLQWIKLYDRKPEYTMMADKYRVREYVAEKIGEEHLVPLLGVWDRAEDIDFDTLPDQFVLKCNHDCGSIVICKDKKTFDIKEAVRRLERCLNRNAYIPYREWPYKDISRKVIAEKYICNGNKQAPKDYKVFCFNGEAKLIGLYHDRFTSGFGSEFFDIDWRPTPVFESGGPNPSSEIMKPAFLDEMLAFSEVLSEGIPHIRVDWYFLDGHLYFGELTFFHNAGFDLHPEEWDYKLGSWITLPEKPHGGWGGVTPYPDCICYQLWRLRAPDAQPGGQEGRLVA